MVEYKRCQCCGTIISSIYDVGFNKYRHIRIKYCDNCRKEIERLKGNARQYDFKQRKKIANSMREERMSLLAEENELLKAMVTKLRNELDCWK